MRRVPGRIVMRGAKSHFVFLALAKYADEWQAHAWLRKSLKVLSLVASVTSFAWSYGLRGASAAFQELWMLRHLPGLPYDANRWSRLRAVKARKIAAKTRAAASAEARLAGAFRCDILTSLTYDRIAAAEDLLDAVLDRQLWAALTDLYEYFTWFGDLRLAGFFRERAMAAALRDQESYPYVLPYTVNGALETGDGARALAVLGSRSHGSVTRDYVVEATALAHMVQGERDRAEELWRERFSEPDAAFLDLVNGRTVAVVGPAVQPEDVGDEIDSFDLVVRTNFNCDSRLPASGYGSRTDVAYYNHAAWVQRPQIVLKSLDRLKWVNLKGRHTDRDLAGMRPEWRGGARVFHQLDRFFNLGGPMAIPNVLYDLLHFSPARVKLFSSDFYAAGVNYHGSYFEGRDRSQSPNTATLSQSLRLHEPFGTFLFTRAMRRARLLEADSMTDSVLDLDATSYASVIQTLFGAHSL